TTLTASALLVALMQTATSLPAFLLSLPAGALADMVDRRKLLLCTQGFMAAVATGLGVLTFMGGVSAFGVLGFTFLLGVGTALNGPIWQTVTTELVPRPVMSFPMILNGVSNNIARAIGPAVGGAIIAYYSPGWVFVLNGVSFLGTWATVYFWKRTSTVTSGPAEHSIGALHAGIRYVQYSTTIYGVLVRTFAFSFGTTAMLVSVVIARKLHLSSDTFGVMLSWMGAGAVAGAYLLGRVGARLSLNRRAALGALTFAGSHLALVLITQVYVLYAVMFVSGIAWPMVMTSFSTTVQLNVPKWVQARVIGIHMLVFQAGVSLDSLMWDELADRLSLDIALLAAAGWMLGRALPARPFPMRSGEGLNLDPLGHFPDPFSGSGIDPDDDPIVVMIECNVEPANRLSSQRAAEQLRRLRLRDGALRAGLFSDVADPRRITEFFYVPTWGEHERQHNRFTKEDQVIEVRVRQYHRGPGKSRVTHLLAFPHAPNVEVATPMHTLESQR
ncbi:MAG: MFS transporter, partial [Hymenobacter sp.]|nr:MFS transporter [Hymenobacter sp.]